jgi:methionyl-tRNA formyltransferase
VYQPGSLRKPENLALLRNLAPDLIAVAAFGQILPPEVLRLAAHGCLNVHASILPRHRGASPVAAAILAGDQETGVTIMLMEEGLDTGPILAQVSTVIDSRETAGELTTRLADLGAHLLVEMLPRWLSGGIQPLTQDQARATMSRILKKTDGWLDWTKPAHDLDRQVRAYAPWPGTVTAWQGKQLKIIQASPLASVGGASSAEPGVVSLSRDPLGQEAIVCSCGEGSLCLQVVQLEGKRPLSASEFVRGYRAIIGSRLGA